MNRYERFFSLFSDGNLCVTQAMQRELAMNWKVQSTVLYDHSPEKFRRLDQGERESVSDRDVVLVDALYES